MRRLLPLLLVTVALVGCNRLSPSAVSDESNQALPNEAEVNQEVEVATVVDILIRQGGFETLLSAINTAQMEAVLRGTGPYTLLAPNDAAFAKMDVETRETLLADQEALQQFLEYHVISGRLLSSDVAQLETAQTLQGDSITVSTNDQGVLVNQSMIVETDLEATNGVVHVIDSVLELGSE